MPEEGCRLQCAEHYPGYIQLDRSDRPMMTDAELEAVFQKWLAERPPKIREMATRWSPYITYTMNGDGDLYQLRSYSEDGTVTVDRYNAATMTLLWRVRGVDPEQLCPWIPDDLREL